MLTEKEKDACITYQFLSVFTGADDELDNIFETKFEAAIPNFIHDCPPKCSEKDHTFKEQGYLIDFKVDLKKIKYFGVSKERVRRVLEEFLKHVESQKELILEKI